MDCLRRNTTQNSTKIWRPWDEDTRKSDPTKCKRLHPYMRHPTSNQVQAASNAHPLQSYLTTFKHPVRMLFPAMVFLVPEKQYFKCHARLYWTKAAYDYMYEAGERLLRNFPVQATIQVIDDSDSSDDEEEDEDDDTFDDNEDRKKENETKDKVQDDRGNRIVEDKKYNV